MEAVEAGCVRSQAHALIVEEAAARVGIDPPVALGAFGKIGLRAANAIGGKLISGECAESRVVRGANLDALNDRILLAVVAAAGAA